MELAVTEFSLSAVRHNLTRIKHFAPNSQILAMVKADAYGHGLINMAKAMSQADAFGVARIGEALKLRAAGIRQDVVLLEGCFDPEEYHIAAQHNFQVCIHNTKQLQQFLALRLTKPMSVWLKLNTGMFRLGFNEIEFNAAYLALSNCEHCLQPITMLTHLACADEPEHELNQDQAESFQNATKQKVGAYSVANSAAIVTRPELCLDWVRPGIMLYGSSPVPVATAQGLDLQPVMTLSSKVIAIQDVKQGDSVGYGAKWQAWQDSTIAVVGVGYGDGYPRHAKSGTPVLINGATYPLVGRVSMDMITVDISSASEVNIGDKVVLWGAGLPAETVALWADTISYQLFCGITNRVPRIYLD